MSDFSRTSDGMMYGLNTDSPQLHALTFAAYIDDETIEVLDEEGPAMFLNCLPLALDRIIPLVPKSVDDEDEWHTEFWNALEDVAVVRMNIKKGIW